MRMFRWLGVAGALLLFALTSIWLGARLLPPTPAQREALERLRPIPPPAGRNAFAALWLFAYDVPADRLEALAEADLDRLRARPAILPNGQDNLFESVAKGAYPRAELTDSERAIVCDPNRAGCLDRMRSDPQAVSDVLARHASVLLRGRALADYDYFWDRIPPSLDAPFVPHTGGSLPLLITQPALDFVQGRTEAGLSGICATAAVWRRMGTRTNSLLGAMVAQAMIVGSARVFAEMLAELPPGLLLPEVCDAAFSPPREGEFSLCEPMRREARIVRRTLDALEAGGGDDGWGRRAVMRLGFDAELAARWLAPSQAFACGVEAQDRASRDLQIDEDSLPAPEIGALQCLAVPFACGLAGLAPGADYARYEWRLLDGAARIRLVSAVLWARGQVPKGAARSSPPPLPEALRSEHRPFELVEQGRALRLRMYDPKYGENWTIPLAPGLGTILVEAQAR